MSSQKYLELYCHESKWVTEEVIKLARLAVEKKFVVRIVRSNVGGYSIYKQVPRSEWGTGDTPKPAQKKWWTKKETEAREWVDGFLINDGATSAYTGDYALLIGAYGKTTAEQNGLNLKEAADLEAARQILLNW